MIKTVFFDLYHTLVRYDPPREEQQIAALAAHGMVTDHQTMCMALQVADVFFYEENARAAIFKRPAHEQMAFYEEYECIVLEQCGFDVSEETALEIFKQMHEAPKKLVLYDDVLPTFDALRAKGITLGLITNAEQGQAPFEQLGLYDLLDYLVTSPDEGMGKPQPHIFWAALRQAGVKASEAIHVGDQYDVDVVGAQGVGIKALLLDRNNMFDQIDDCPKISSLTEIVAHL
ncbi:MAG: HAD family hydrolase [Chloroflexi bacterium]|jgi:putative hydrolase of the HAD superfamily|nr:HAD family hydrolase [Chloroflexota bacterium]MBT7080354.1 HAD family hydrolase [Chloroflexota bacterium]MBT7290519.1 HAD family hydrolase [Chloroflexota bacterium]